MLQELIEAMEAAAQDDAVRCVVLTGAGRAFGAGLDLTVLASQQARGDVLKVSEGMPRYHHLIHVMQGMPKPIIGAIRGIATGISCNLALACDLRIAADNARLIEGFARIGVIPDGGAGYLLPRLIGLGRALDLSLLAEEVSGPEAERIGLVTRCVPIAEFETTVTALAKRLANGPTRAYGLIKELLYTSLDMNLQASLDLEGQLQDSAFTTADYQEGVNAFMQKRAPHYSGK